MNTKELESCLHIIGYWLNEDETVIEKILNNETQIVKRFVEPFSKELNANLLNKDTIEAKKDLIKFYVFEFWELQGFYKEYDEILFTGSLCNYTPVFYEHTNENGTVRKLNEFENYVVNSWSLFNMLFNEIQICCIKYKIDFFKVCYELNFSLEYFDSGISIAFEEMQKENLPPQQTETKTPTAPAIALFCNLINEAEIIKKESDEIPEIYCKRICEKYNLKYTDRVRQNFNGNKSKRHYKGLTEIILPCIDETTKDKIQKHLDSKNLPKQKLYA